MSEEIRRLAMASSVPPFEHKFIPTGHLVCSGDANMKVEFGEVEYGSPNYIMCGAVRLKEWLFCLERSHFQEGYFLCAFLGREHFTFGRMNASNSLDAQRDFISTCMLDFCPFLYADELSAIGKKTNEQTFTWKKVVTKEKEEVGKTTEEVGKTTEEVGETTENVGKTTEEEVEKS